MRATQYTQLVDEAIYDGRLNTDAFHGPERIELINALLDQWGYETEASQQVVDLVERLAPVSTLAVNMLPETDRPGHPCRRDHGGAFVKRFTAPTTDNDVTERLPDDSNGNNVYIFPGTLP